MVPKTIWLTGSRGFVGRSVASVFEGMGARVLRFTNQAQESSQVAQMNYLDRQDIRQNLQSFGRPDIFIHAGWGEMTKPESPVHLGENVQASRMLIETLFGEGLSTFVFVGSMNEYGARTGLLSEDLPPEGRLTNYAKGKIEVARFGFEAARAASKTFIHARTFYVFGAGQRQGSLINDLHQAYRTGAEVNLSPCEHFRDYIHVSQVAEGLRRLTEVKESTTVNLGSGNAIKVKDFVLLFWKRLGGDNQKLRFGARQLRSDEPEQPRSYADLTRLRGLIGWAPSLSLEDGIKLTIKDFRL
jgi:nucleoside-diphosphate-sugar epimerase